MENMLYLYLSEQCQHSNATKSQSQDAQAARALDPENPKAWHLGRVMELSIGLVPRNRMDLGIGKSPKLEDFKGTMAWESSIYILYIYYIIYICVCLFYVYVLLFV